MPFLLLIDCVILIPWVDKDLAKLIYSDLPLRVTGGFLELVGLKGKYFYIFILDRRIRLRSRRSSWSWGWLPLRKEFLVVRYACTGLTWSRRSANLLEYLISTGSGLICLLTGFCVQDKGDGAPVGIRAISWGHNWEKSFLPDSFSHFITAIYEN